MFFDGALIFSWWWVVRWSWKPYSGPAEIASFSRRDFSQPNKHDTFWHVVLIGYFYSFLLWAIAVSNFRPLEIHKNLGLLLSAITFTINNHTDKQFNKHIYLFIFSNILHEISFFIKIHVKVFHIQIWRKCEAPFLFFQIKTMIYRKNPLQKKISKIIKLHVVHTLHDMQSE